MPDIMFLLQTTTPDITFLQAKFGKKTRHAIIETIVSDLNNTDWNSVITDVKPFLLNPQDAEKIRLFPDFLQQKLG